MEDKHEDSEGYKEDRDCDEKELVSRSEREEGDEGVREERSRVAPLSSRIVQE